MCLSAWEVAEMAADSVRVGRRFGRLAVASEDEPYLWRGRFSRRRWLCACDCGGEAVVREDRLRGGTTLSCGCLRKEVARDRSFRHGGAAGGRVAPEYGLWKDMVRGRKGAPVCRRWGAGEGGGYAAFLRDMGPRPSPAHRLVRRDPAKGYAPRNCHWALAPPRAGVPRRFLRYQGCLLTLKDAALASGVGYGRLCKRLERGWPPAEALRP
jgi:hypothetical protein